MGYKLNFSAPKSIISCLEMEKLWDKVPSPRSTSFNPPLLEDSAAVLPTEWSPPSMLSRPRSNLTPPSTLDSVLPLKPSSPKKEPVLSSLDSDPPARDTSSRDGSSLEDSNTSRPRLPLNTPKMRPSERETRSTSPLPPWLSASLMSSSAPSKLAESDSFLNPITQLP